MARHRKKSPLGPILACLAAIAIIGGAALLNENLYANISHKTQAAEPKIAVKLTVDGHERTILTASRSAVRTALDQNNITLDSDDQVSPSLSDPVTEDGRITITSTATSVETSDEPIPFNTITKETSDLPKGEQKTQTEGQNGIMEATKLVQRNNGKIVSSNTFTAQVKTPPTDKIILIGTKDPTTSLGVTTPVGDMQKWAHDYLISTNHTEDDFTAANYIISHESGWRVDAANPSGAYGLPQAYPGIKMASAGDDWKTNYQTQFKWFIGYCENRYGGLQQAYQHWLTTGSY